MHLVERPKCQYNDCKNDAFVMVGKKACCGHCMDDAAKHDEDFILREAKKIIERKNAEVLRAM